MNREGVGNVAGELGHRGTGTGGAGGWRKWVHGMGNAQGRAGRLRGESGARGKTEAREDFWLKKRRLFGVFRARGPSGPPRRSRAEPLPPPRASWRRPPRAPGALGTGGPAPGSAARSASSGHCGDSGGHRGHGGQRETGGQGGFGTDLRRKRKNFLRRKRRRRWARLDSRSRRCSRCSRRRNSDTTGSSGTPAGGASPRMGRSSGGNGDCSRGEAEGDGDFGVPVMPPVW